MKITVKEVNKEPNQPVNPKSENVQRNQLKPRQSLFLDKVRKRKSNYVEKRDLSKRFSTNSLFTNDHMDVTEEEEPEEEIPEGEEDQDKYLKISEPYIPERYSDTRSPPPAESLEDSTSKKLKLKETERLRTWENKKKLKKLFDSIKSPGANRKHIEKVSNDESVETKNLHIQPPKQIDFQAAKICR